MIGTEVGHYRILSSLGTGGMGEVYVAQDERLDRKVALKILPPLMAGDREARKRFEREARSVAALNHPNIVTIYSVEQADGRHFLTMELVEGQSLRGLIPAGGFALENFRRHASAHLGRAQKRAARRCGPLQIALSRIVYIGTQVLPQPAPKTMKSASVQSPSPE